jgi:hypothetical protein
MVARGMPCLGPVTQSGCGALCPTFGRGCYGCFGPREQANATSLARTFELGGREGEEVSRLFAGFTGWAGPFRDVIGEFGGPPGMTPGGTTATTTTTTKATTKVTTTTKATSKVATSAKAVAATKEGAGDAR